MRGPEHYRAAEQAVEESRRCPTPGAARMWLQKAAIHAQLAYTAALVDLTDADTDRAWREVIGQDPAPAGPADRPVREVLAMMHGGQPAGRTARLIPEDTCGSRTGGLPCVLRPGHDEPCLPYRAPAQDPAMAACGAAKPGRPNLKCTWPPDHMFQGWPDHHNSFTGESWPDPDVRDPSKLTMVQPGPGPREAGPAGPASRDEGGPGPEPA